MAKAERARPDGPDAEPELPPEPEPGGPDGALPTAEPPWAPRTSDTAVGAPAREAVAAVKPRGAAVRRRWVPHRPAAQLLLARSPRPESPQLNSWLSGAAPAHAEPFALQLADSIAGPHAGDAPVSKPIRAVGTSGAASPAA